jgi:cytochrome P450 family 142 subfamily A polypeptide 1
VVQEFLAVTSEIIEARRADPRDDLISIWTHQDGWDTGHVLEETILVLDGGAETTRTVIGSMIRDLALHPEQRRLLLEVPELLGTTAVEEFIRWVSPVLNMRRTATVDHELHGQQIRSGDRAASCTPPPTANPRASENPGRARCGPAAQPPRRAWVRRTSVSVRSLPGSRSARCSRSCCGDARLGAHRPGRAEDPAGHVRRAYDEIRIRFTPS